MAPTTMPPMAPPVRDLDDEISDGVEGDWDEPAVGEVSAVVVGAAVVAVDEGVLEEVEVVSVAAIKLCGLKGQEVASGSAALRDE